MALGDLIRQKRERLRWSQVELSKRAGVSQSLISQMEENKRGTRVDIVVKVTDVLGIDPSEVFDYVRGMEPKHSRAPIVDVLAQVDDILQRLKRLEQRTGTDAEASVRARFLAGVPA